MDQIAALTSGTTLSGRYRLDDLIKEAGGAATWKAYDKLLDRSVGVQALRADDRRATAFVLAAGRSTAVGDPRFLRVLDIVEDDHGHTYLVREWARAVSLDHVLGPATLTNGRAARVALNLADAMAAAHDAGVYHRHLRPATVLLKDTGAVRIIGLATDHALLSAHHDVDESDVVYAERVDVEGVGKLLYACLTGRYPGGDELLAPAPREHGRLLRPRQVRAGVGHDIDVVTDRILGNPPRHHRPRLLTARDVALELSMIDDDPVSSDPDVMDQSSPDLFRHDPVRSALEGPPPAVHPPKPKPAALAPPPPSAIERSVETIRRSAEGERRLIWIALAVIVVLAATLTFIVGRVSAPSATPQTPTPTSAAPSAVGTVVDLPIRGIDSFDPPPEGDGDENPQQASLAIDGQTDTSWTTKEYYRRNDLGGLKDGVGLLLDLGRMRDVTSVQVLFGSAPTSFRIYAAPGRTDAPSTLDQMQRVGGYSDAPTGASVGLSGPVRTRYVLLWLTRLPEREPNVYQGEVSDITVRGYE